jgi:hypothetical protein
MNLKTGFQRGNKAAPNASDDPIDVMARSHGSLRRVVKNHMNSGTLHTLEGRSALLAAAHHAMGLHHAEKDRPDPMAERVKQSMTEIEERRKN